MKFSEDGRSLFVYGAFNLNVLELDASNGNVLHTYESNANPNYPLPGSAIAVMHPNGDPILVTPWGLVYGLRTREELPHLTPFSIPYNAMSFAVSPDQSLLLPHWGTPSRVTLSALDGGGLRSEWPAVDSAFGSDSADSCVAAAGDRLYISHSSNESRVAGVSVATAQLVQSLPTNNRWANSLQCVWNGLLVVGLSDYYGPIDMRVFNGPTGVELATLSSDGTGPGNPNWNYRDLERFGLAVSADGTRVFSAWENSPGIIESGYAIQTLPAP
jgi:hypothetical protein